MDVNDFLHDVSPYVTDRPLPPFRVPTAVGRQPPPHPSAPPSRHLRETAIFHDDHERRFTQISEADGDDIHLGSSSGHGGGQFNQFGSNEEVFRRSDILNTFRAAQFPGSEPESSSRGYGFGQRKDTRAPSSSIDATRTRSQRIVQQGMSSGGQLPPAYAPSSAAVGGDTSDPANEQSEDAWSGHSSPPEFGNDNPSVPSQREAHEDGCEQPGGREMDVDDPSGRMDEHPGLEEHRRPFCDAAGANATIQPAAAETAGVVAVTEAEARVPDEGSEGAGKKKKIDTVFLDGIPLVDLDAEVDLPDMKLSGDFTDSEDEEDSNPEHMDVDVGAS